MPLSVGTRLGPYEILAPLGAGGMGEVYKACDTRLDRVVAIKTSKAQFSERFAREARAIAALNHPHICQLYDVGPDYLVMEYVEGSPLKGPLGMEKAVEYAGQILSALDAAHRKGITHRDLKPANVLVAKQGIKLLDFGLARTAATSGDETITMAVMGTPAYMAPEQWEGKPGDARSDIYAFGCVLYETLTGKRAGPERTPVDSPVLESVVKTCLAKDPEERWQTAREVKIALAPSSNFVPVSRLGGRPYWVAIAALAAVAIALAVVHFRERPASGDVVSFAVYPPEKTAFSATLNTTVNVPEFALSPDGRTLAIVASAAGAPPMLWLRSLSDVDARLLPGTENAQDPFWSPDSLWLGFFAGERVKKIPAAGGAVQAIAETRADFRGGSWGPDETILFASGTEPIYRVNSAGGATTPVSIMDGVGTHRFPYFLPDGRHFLYSVTNASVERVGLYAGSVDGKTKKLLVRVGSSAVYAPPGYLLFVEGDALMAQRFDPDRLEVSGQPFLVAEHVGSSSAFYSGVSASRGGRVAYAGLISPLGRLTWFDRGGGALGSVGPEGDAADFRLSPNERLVAASLADPKSGTLEIWMTDLGRNNTSRFAFGSRLTASPVWLPDSARLAYRSVQGGLTEFYQRSAGGGGSDEPLLKAEAERAGQIQSINLVPTDWAPDGGRIIFSVPAPASGTDLWLLPLAGDRKPVKFLATPADEMHANLSPDGHFVAYTSNESRKLEVYVQTLPLSDRKWQVSTNGGYEPRWRADGREIYYLSADRKLMAVSVGPGPSFNVPKPLFQTRVPAGVSANRTHYVPSRDGLRFLVNTESGDAAPTPITVTLNWTAGLKK